MAIKLENIVPFGRSLTEYQRMFSLTAEDLSQTILGVGDGPASFNAEMKAQGKFVVSIDPVYRFTAREIENQFHSVVDNIISQIKETPGDWVWSYHQSPDHLKEIRTHSLNQFLADYENGKAEGRYRVDELPSLNFEDDQFDLGLCSHLLFLYSDHLSYEFHAAAILEMLRVAKEVRIFPLITLDFQMSPYVAPLIRELENNGYEANVETVAYELQRGGNQMLTIKRIKRH